MKITGEKAREREPLKGRTERVGTIVREQANSRSGRSRVSKTSKGLWTSIDPSSLAILRDILHPLQKLVA